MAKPKWTKGPWQWVNNVTDEPFDFSREWDGNGSPSLRAVWEVDTKSGWLLPEFIMDAEPGYIFDNPVNAHLMAAAPEMADVLEWLMKEWLLLCHAYGIDGASASKYIAAAAALTKARGEQ
jgi:hypothetical protein